MIAKSVFAKGGPDLHFLDNDLDKNLKADPFSRIQLFALTF